MATWHRLVAWGAGGLLLANTAFAAPPAASDSAPAWGRVNTLAGLPAEVSAYLIERTGLADQGGDYNDSCVIDYYRPSMRFVLGAVSENDVIVAVEHGGRGHGINTWSFRRENNHWKPREQGRITSGVTLMTAKILVEQHQKSTHHL